MASITSVDMMPSLRFGLKTMAEEANLKGRCLFCRGKNILCSSTWKYKCGQQLLSDMNLKGLPESLLLHVFLFLDLRDLFVARKVSRMWKRIAEDRQLWKTTNFSCKRITESCWLFSLPRTVISHIRVLNLMWSYFSIPAFRNILKAFPNVEVLLLNNCKFSSNGESTKRLKTEETLPRNLKILDVRNIQDRWFDEHTFGSRFLSLEAVAFSQTLPNNWLSILSESWLPKLQILHIQNNPCVTETFIEGIINSSPLLQSINLHGCMYINGNFLKNAIEKLPSLKHLDLNSTRFDGRNVLKVKWHQSSLRSLNISFCCKITSNDLKFLLPKLTSLKHLQASFVGWGKVLNDDVIAFLPRDQTLFLECIDLQSTFAMSSNALTQLCGKCPRLKNLRVGTVLKTETELSSFLDSIPVIEELSLQVGESSFSAIQLFELLANKCLRLRSIFLYNILFDMTESKINAAIHTLFVSLNHIENFFVGGYPHRERNRIEELISKIAENLQLKINFKRPKRIIPQHEGCFDQFLGNFISIPYYNALGLKTALQRTHDCQSFYQTGLQKLNNSEFPLVRS